MRCLIIMHSFGGGAEALALTLAQYMSPDRIQVTLACTRHIPALAAQKPDGIPLHMPAPGRWAALRHLWHVRMLARHSDVVLGSLELQSIFWAALLGGRRANSPCVSWLHKDIEGYLSRKGSAYGWLYRQLLGWAFRRSSHIVCVSEGLRQSSARLWPDLAQRFLVLWNPIDLTRIHQRAQNNLPLALQPFFDGRRPIILAVGRLEKQKAFHRLLRAFALLRQQGLDCGLCIAGEGAERLRLEGEVQRLGLTDSVLIPGFCDPFPLMTRSAALAMSSLFEGLPTVLIEALALHLPVVSVDCPSGPAEVLDNGRYGTLVPMPSSDDDVAALAHALEHVLREPPDTAQREANALRAEDFALSRTVKAWEALLTKAAGKP